MVSLPGWSQKMSHGFIIIPLKRKNNSCSKSMMEILSPRNFVQLPLLESRCPWFPGTTVNSVIYCGILTHLYQKIQQQHKNKWEHKVLMPGPMPAVKQHRHKHPLGPVSDNIHCIHWIWLHRIMPFDKMKDPLCTLMKTIPKEWFSASISKLPERWQ